MGLLVLIGFVGTFVIMAFELREFFQRRHRTFPLPSRFPTVPDLRSANSRAPHTAIPVDKVYDAAA